MKILIEPMLSVLVKELSDADKAELLMCILEYPMRDCELSIWKYARQQIDIDAKKYKDKCARMAENAKLRWACKSEVSVSKESESKSNKIKNNVIVKESESSNAKKIVENSVQRFQITDTFNFVEIGQENPAFANFIKLYLPPIVARAEKTLTQKRTGQWITIPQILDWLEQERTFYQQNHGGKA